MNPTEELLDSTASLSPLEMSPAFELTERALFKAHELQKDFPRYRHLPLRLYVEGKGCDGFTYGVSFDAALPDDIQFEWNKLDCIIDPQSLMFCKGSVIDWVDDERGTGFLVENPQQRKFRGKFYKRQVWIDRLSPSQKPTAN